VKRLVAQELTLSFVPDAEQLLWRTVMRRRYQVARNRVQLHNRLQSLLEEACIKLSSVVSDLLGTSDRHMLPASPTARRIRRRWPHWRACACARRPTNYATPSVRARISIPSIGNC
jgi:transposase